MRVSYNRKDYSTTYELDISWLSWEALEESHEVTSAIETCAEDYFNNRDGDESTWPIEFSLYVDGKHMGTEEVQLEYEPTFVAT